MAATVGQALRALATMGRRVGVRRASQAVYTAKLPMIAPDSYPVIPTFRVLGLDGSFEPPADLPAVGARVRPSAYIIVPHPPRTPGVRRDDGQLVQEDGRDQAARQHSLRGPAPGLGHERAGGYARDRPLKATLDDGRRAASRST